MGSLKRITIHHTAGRYTPNDCDKSHYHYLVDGDGNIVEGIYKPSDNINCKDGVYAPHSGGANTGNIGIAICGCYNDNYPIKRVQLEACCKKVAELSKLYGITVTSRNILTHAELGQLLPHSTSYGKIDITNLPCVCVWGRENVGNYIRERVQEYRNRV